jgi:nucleotide-binding universal stress UspA family protein
VTGLSLQRTRFAGVYRRGSRFVVVYRSRGRQRERAAATLAEAQAIKLVRDAQARAERRGAILHAFALGWLDRYAGSGRDSVRRTRAASTVGCSRRSRCATSTTTCVCAISTAPPCRGWCTG